MGFYLYTGNRLEVLVAKNLCHSILSSPLSDPFKPETIVVQSQGMAAWLKQQIAEHSTITANINFPFLNNFINDVLDKVLTPSLCPDRSYFKIETMTWRLFEILSEQKDKFPDLKSYISGDDIELKQFQLAERIAETFDQYQLYRPDLIIQWEETNPKNDKFSWQTDLWKELSKDKISRSRGLINFFKDADLAQLDYERIFVVGISTMPVVYLDFFQKLGETLDVHFFYLNPCAEDWQFNLSNKEEERLLRKVVQNNTYNEEDYLIKGNHLLSAFGRVGREFFSTILEATEYNDQSSFVDPGTNSILSTIQHDILKNTNSEKLKLPQDNSIQIHNCHSQTREVEILYDNLLNIIKDDPKIQPRDIVIITPDISSYAPFISAVFDRRNNELKTENGQYRPVLPYSLSDVNIAQKSKIIETFFNLLNLNDSKFRVSEILDILETEAVCSAFQIEDNNLEIIRKWITESGMRWGIDANHRKKLELPEFFENSITAGLDSLLLGYAMEDSPKALPRAKVLPYDEIEIAEAKTLGKFSHFLHSLFELQKILSKPDHIGEWTRKLSGIIETYFVNDNNTYRDIALLRKTINNLETSAVAVDFKSKISIEVIKTFLRKKMETETVNEGFMRGKITFCTMLPMRSIPSKVICMLGMDDGVFPRREKKLGFNILGKDIRICDRSKRFEDYYLFLESILAARKILYISYIGQCINTNEPIPPAPPVSELIDYLSEIVSEDIHKSIIQKHKLQAFNQDYFVNPSKLFSFSKTDCDSAKTLLKEQQKRAIFDKFSTTTTSKATNLTLEDLISFYKNPCKAILRKELGINITPTHNFVEDIEPIEFTGIERYSVNQRIIDCIIENRPTEDLYLQLKLEGKLPVGNRGKLLFKQQVANIKQLYCNTTKDLGSPQELLSNISSFDIDITINETKITGTLHNLVDDRQVYFQVAEKNGKRIIEAWIKHLIFVASGKGKTTYCFIGNKPGREYYAKKCPEISQEEAQNELIKLLEIYKKGLSAPIPFFPNTSFQYCCTKKDKDSAARKKFLSGYNSRGEVEDPYISLCFDDTILQNNNFKECSKTIFNHYWVEEEKW